MQPMPAMPNEMLMADTVGSGASTFFILNGLKGPRFSRLINLFVTRGQSSFNRVEIKLERQLQALPASHTVKEHRHFHKKRVQRSSKF